MKRGWLLGLLLSIAGCGRLGFGDADDQTGAAKLKIAYPYPSSYHAILGETALSLQPGFEGIEQFRVSPALPAGLTFNDATGKISGVPTAEADRVKYTITGSGPAGELSVDIHLTALTGWQVTAGLDRPDDDGGNDTTCFSTAADGCTLRAAVETANQHPEKKRLILLPGKPIPVNAVLTPLLASMVIAGEGIAHTVLAPEVAGQSQGLLELEAIREIRLENLSVEGFTPAATSAVTILKGTFEAFDVRFYGNTAATAGGVIGIGTATGVVPTRAHFEDVTFLTNEVLGAPGWGAVVMASGAATEVTVHRATATSNKSSWGSFAYLDSGATLRLVNSTLAGNEATTAGVLVSPDGNFFVTSSTIAHNTILGSQSAGLYLNEAGAKFTVANSIIAHNKVGSGDEVNCDRLQAKGTLISLGGNLLGDDAGNCAAAFTAPGDLLGVDPRLAAAAPLDAGGHTKTLPLQSDSKALGRGVAAHCPTHDQRGVPRGLDAAGACDSGAFELE